MLYLAVLRRRYVHKPEEWSVDHYGPFQEYGDAVDHVDAWIDVWRDHEPSGSVEFMYRPAGLERGVSLAPPWLPGGRDAFRAALKAEHELGERSPVASLGIPDDEQRDIP